MISNKSLKNVQWLDTTLFMFFLTIIQSMIYGLAIMTMHWHFIICVNFILLIIAYGYSYWILKHCSDILFFTFRTLSKRNELMMNRKVTSELSLSHGSASDPCTIKGHPLIQCSYLETFIFDGRCEHLFKYNLTPVLDARDRESKTINSEMIYNLCTNVFSFIASFVETFALFGNILYLFIFTYTLACTSLDTEYIDHFDHQILPKTFQMIWNLLI